MQCVHFGINFDAYSDNMPMTKPNSLDKNLKNYILSVGTDRHRDIELLDELAYRMKDKNFILSVGTDRHRDIELLDELAYRMQDKNFILCSCNPQYLNKNYKSSNLKVVSADLYEMRYLYKNKSV